MAWLGTFLASALFKYFIGPLLLAGIAFGGYEAWKWHVGREALIEAQREALVKAAVNRHDKKVVEGNVRILDDTTLIECTAGRLECCKQGAKCTAPSP